MLNSDTQRKLNILKNLFHEVQRDQAEMLLCELPFDCLSIGVINKMFEKYSLMFQLINSLKRKLKSDERTELALRSAHEWLNKRSTAQATQDMAKLFNEKWHRQ